MLIRLSDDISHLNN